MKFKKIIYLVFGWLLLVQNAPAQIVSNYELTLEGAQLILNNAMDYAKEHHAPGGAIAIVDAGGHLILLARISGTFPAASDVAYGKARTGAIFRFPTKKLEDAIIGGRGSLITVGENMLRCGLPILYNGNVIGGIGVSGAASADQDVEIAEAGLKADFL